MRNVMLQKCKLKEKDEQNLDAHASVTSVLRNVLTNRGMTKQIDRRMYDVSIA